MHIVKKAFQKKFFWKAFFKFLFCLSVMVVERANLFLYSVEVPFQLILLFYHGIERITWRYLPVSLDP